jgi:hypothetical protein
MRTIRSVHVGDAGKRPGSGGDIWALTWADDGQLYASTGDTTGNPEGLYGAGGFGSGRNADVVKVYGSARRPRAHCRVRTPSIRWSNSSRAAPTATSTARGKRRG